MKILKSNRAIDEQTARALVAMEVSISVDALLADKVTLGEIRSAIDALPPDVGAYYELAYFNEVGRRYQAGKAPWRLVTFFAPDGLKQGVH